MMWDFAADLVEILSEVEAHRQAAVEKIRSVLGGSMSLAQSSSKLRRKHLKNSHIAHEKYLGCIYYVRSMVSRNPRCSVRGLPFRFSICAMFVVNDPHGQIPPYCYITSHI